MLKPKEIAEIGLSLWYLPLDKVADIKKIVLAWKKECGYDQPTDDSNEWTEEDLQEANLESMRRLEKEDPWPEEVPQSQEPPPRNCGTLAIRRIEIGKKYK
jgi:hypothetical protein